MEKQNSRYRWVVFATVLFAYFLIVSQRTAPGLITDQLMIDFKVTASTIGLLTSVQFLAYSSLQVPIGLLSDRYGPNLFLIVGALLNGIGTVMYSLAPNEYFLLFSRLLVGIGDATIWVNLVLILSQWFKVKEFISLLGFAGMSGSLGFLMATFPFSAWIDLTGWRMAFLTTGILLCLCGFILYYVLVKKPKQLFKQEEKKKAAREKPESTIVLLCRLVTDRQAWATFLCHFGLVGTYVGFIGSWAVPYGINMYDMTRSEASQLIMIGLVGAIIGAPVSTWLSNRLGTIKLPYVIVHFIILISWITLFLFAGKPPFYLLIILFLLIGFGNGASALTFATVRQSFPMRVVGVVSGFANTGGFLSAVLLPSIFGKILDHFPGALGYQYGLLIPLIFSLLGCMGGLLIKGQQTEVSTGLHA
ncbi:MFS transporter [Lederbergia galactosidilytica]|uniref:Lysosomal dipeptide transporter MFSD1 n=1 Tax=Lederbergia galactosidilytica TaxID=217031 RepID=A0A177ZHW2_9BACI|nr:MFS transporter [Lederbergia galactosidilytica]OAK67354.1 MFS transporter [Lederbergia galactosidilytica]